MAFVQPNAQRELANRKILEELQLKKQLLLKQGVQSSITGTAPPSSPLPVCSIPTVNSVGYTQTTEPNAAQRAALHNANATSCGFFVAQDSSFGNQILPVLPRL